MRIKAVCEATGLSDRAVRYYIDEGLISPVYSENYTGRRNFDFSEADVSALNDIALLRKYGFSVSEIRDMLNKPDRIPVTIDSFIERKSAMVDEERSLLSALESVCGDSLASVSSLAKALSELALPAPDSEAITPLYKKILRVVHRILLVLLAVFPVWCAIKVLNSDFRNNLYPVISPICILLAILSLTPSVLILLLPLAKKNIKWKRRAGIALVVLILLNVPFSMLLSGGIVCGSVTTDYFNYMIVDTDINHAAVRYAVELFPKQPQFYKVIDGERVDIDAHYLYRNLSGWDYTYDIYAEFPIEQEELATEIDRVRELMDSKVDDHEYPVLTNVKKGSWDCMILYYYGAEPFEKVKDNYTYYIFAYNEETMKVRYLLCDSLDNGEYQPYYLQLDW